MSDRIEPVRPNFVESFLTFLKQFNHLHSDVEINVDNILEGLTGFGEQKDYIEEIMTKNISQPIPIILEQNFSSGQKVTNESSNIHNNLQKEKETLYEKITSSISQHLEIILEQNNIETEPVSNSAPQIDKGQNPLSAF